MTQQPSLFRKKPVTVQAVQYPCAHPALRRCSCDRDSACSSCGCEFIETLEGRMNVSPGDWIITGAQGEHYPCKPDIFAAAYELADTPPASAQDDAKDERQYWMTCTMRHRMVVDNLRFSASHMRDKENRARAAYLQEYMGAPMRWLADVYADAAAVFEAKLAALSASQQQEG